MSHGNACLSGQDKRQADSLFTRGVENTKILPGDMGKVQQCPKLSYTDLACHNSDYKKSKKL